MERTEEQQAIVDASKTYKVLKIEAKSGSGKSSTLIEVSKEIIQPSLYLTFNRNMAEEALGKFPSHVDCKTTHSLAYGTFGRDYQHKLSRPKGRYQNVAGTASEIAMYYKIKPIFQDDQCAFSSIYMGLLVQSTVNRFEQSKDKHLTADHVPHREIRDKKSKYADVDVKEVRKQILLHATQLWKDRVDLLSPVLSTHDTYLKLYQMSSPRLNYDVIYLDEAQDNNAVMLDIVMKQDCKIIIVGDSYQSIYQFRGAINALAQTQAATLPLTKSFRFGDEVAELANIIIKPTNRVEGSGSTTIAPTNEMSVEDLPKGSALLFRTNVGLVLTAVDLISQGIHVDFPNSLSTVKSAISSALALKAGELKKVKHTSLIPFSSWEEFKEGSKDDPELKAIYNLTSGSEKELKFKLAQLDKNDPTQAYYILRTAHSAKGLEWDTVMVMGDFSDKPEDYIKNQQETNLLYVATTRARKAMYYNPVVDDMKAVSHDAPEGRADMAKLHAG